MKVLLIAPPIMDVVDGELRVVGVDALRECPPLGIYGLAAVLEAQGHEVVIADLILHGSRSLGAFETALDTRSGRDRSPPPWPGPTALDVIDQVRQRRPEVPIVCGGIHPTLFDRYILRPLPGPVCRSGRRRNGHRPLVPARSTGHSTSSEVPNLSWTIPDGQLMRNPIDPKLRHDELAALPVSPISNACRRLRTSVSPSSRRAGARSTARSAARRTGKHGGRSTRTLVVDRLERVSSTWTGRLPAACTSSTTSSR